MFALSYRFRDFEECLEMGMDWTLREGYAWAEDKEHCEEYGRMLQADPTKVSSRAKKRGLPQVSLVFFLESVRAHVTIYVSAGYSGRRQSLRRSAGGGRYLRRARGA